MKTKPTVLILSDNDDFIESLSALVTRELGLNCKSIRAETEINTWQESILITNQTLTGSYNLPLIKVDLPIKINSLLDSITATLHSLKTDDVVAIPPDLLLSLQHKTLSRKGQESSIDLTDKEANILQMLAISGEEGISKEILLKEIWNIDTELDTHTLETHIYRLRKKIKDMFGSEMIKAIDGGYGL